jgi:hypothetical protein
MRKASLALLLFGLAVSASPAATQPAAQIAGIPQAQLRRFMAASLMGQVPSVGHAAAYDLATRCAVILPTVQPGVSATPQPYLIAYGDNDEGTTALALANAAGTEFVRSIARPGAEANATCRSRIGRVYGEGFSAQTARFGAITRHAIAVLNGAQVGGPGSTASARDIASTEQARRRIAGQIRRPILLGYSVSSDRTLLVIGEPGSTLRWVAGYRNLPNGTWQFEGAEDAGVRR